MIEISKAIIAVMTAVDGVAKSMTVGEGTKGEYKGVSDKDVKELIRTEMIKNGLSILPIAVNPKIQIDRWEEVDQYSKSVPKDMKTKQSIFTEVDTKYLLLHTSGESIELAGYGQGVDTQDKGAGKSTTYALKNTLLNMFLVPTGVDTDNTHSDEYDIPKTQKTIQSEEKEWFKQENWEKFIKLEWDFKDPTDAIKEIKKKYGMSHQWTYKVENFYRTGNDLPLDSFPKK